MIDLQTLAEIAAAQRPYHDLPVAPLQVADRILDTDRRAAITAVVNLSPDSTYRTSIAPDTESAVRKALVAVAQGADLVDLGAESTNERAGRVSEQEQVRALQPVVRELSGAGVATSVESYSPRVIERLLECGAAAVNLTGAAHDDAVFSLVAQSGATLILCYVPQANVRDEAALPPGAEGVATVAAHLRPRLERARELGVRSVVLDPGIGFSYANLRDPKQRLAAQSNYLLFSGTLRELGFPVMQSLPNAFSVFQEHYRAAEGYFAVLALLGGAGVLRVHEVGHVRAVREALSIDLAAGDTA